MKNAIGIISCTCRIDMLKELTRIRPMAAVPYGGRYRLIDFALSNMVNTGIRTIGIITPRNYRPILDHLRSGKDWFLDRKSGGLFILPSTGTEGFGKNFEIPFHLKDLYNNLDYLRKASEEHVILSSCALVFNMDFKEALTMHRKQGRDITLIYSHNQGGGGISLGLDKDRRVTALKRGGSISSLNVIIIRRELLIDLLYNRHSHGKMNIYEVIGREIGNLGVFGYPYKGYVGRITSVKDYFRVSMELLKPQVRGELLTEGNKVHTKITDNPPTTYGRNAKITNSIVGSGCKVEGKVANSILFRAAEIGPNSNIENSIVMQKNIIGENVVLKNVILDKFVKIRDGTVLVGSEEEPIIIEKGADIGPEEAKVYV